MRCLLVSRVSRMLYLIKYNFNLHQSAKSAGMKNAFPSDHAD
jgi:hypothetical protein